MMKVCWITNQASPYKMKLLNTLGKKVELEVYLFDDKTEIRGNYWYCYDDNNIKLKFIDKHYLKNVSRSARECDLLIDSMYSTKYGIIANVLFRINNKKTIMHADGGIAKDRGFFINFGISVLMKLHNNFLSSSEYTDEYLKYYGVNVDKIEHYRFTSLTNEDLINNEALASLKKDKNKRIFNILSVGQPIYRKGFDILVEVFNNLEHHVHLTIIGGKPQKSVLDKISKNKVDDITFVDSICKEELYTYYSNSDLFILCTREDIWGLVINEALSFSLPTITTNKCIAGLHFNKINQSVTIVDVDDIDAYIKEINRLIEDEEYYYKKVKLSRDVIKGYVIENTCEDIYVALNYFLNYGKGKRE